MKKSKDKNYYNKYILDTSAIFTFLKAEAGVKIVEELLEKAEKHEIEIYISFVTITEVFYILYQSNGKRKARKIVQMLKTMPVQIIGRDDILDLKTGEIKATYKVSFADAWIIATAIIKDAVLVHKDPEMESVETIIKSLKLPYKKQLKE